MIAPPQKKKHMKKKHFFWSFFRASYVWCGCWPISSPSHLLCGVFLEVCWLVLVVRFALWFVVSDCRLVWGC